MMIALLHYIGGYLKIKIRASYAERFFNLCGKKEILLWKIIYKKEYYECFVSRRGFREMDAVIQKTNTEVTVLEKYGLPFFLYRHRKRKFFALGLIFCAALVFLLSLFVWDIQIIGTYSHTEEEILKYMAKKQIHSGVRKAELDCAKLEEDMREDFEDVAWVSCELEGTQLIVHLKEALETEPKNQAEQPCDISAMKSATITKIITREGTPLVKKGDKVKKGDTLISGLVYIYDDANELLEAGKVAADGEVYGETSYKYRDQFEASYYEKAYTGEESENYTIHLGSCRLKLWKKTKTAEKYDIVSEKKQLKLGTNLYLPFALEKLTLKQYKEKRKTDSKEEMRAKAKKHLQRFLQKLKKKGVVILENHVKIEIDEESCSAKGEIVVTESIGKIRSIKRSDVEDALKGKEESNSEGQ